MKGEGQLPVGDLRARQSVHGAPASIALLWGVICRTCLPTVADAADATPTATRPSILSLAAPISMAGILPIAPFSDPSLLTPCSARSPTPIFVCFGSCLQAAWSLW